MRRARSTGVGAKWEESEMNVGNPRQWAKHSKRDNSEA